MIDWDVTGLLVYYRSVRRSLPSLGLSVYVGTGTHLVRRTRSPSVDTRATDRPEKPTQCDGRTSTSRGRLFEQLRKGTLETYFRRRTILLCVYK